MRRLAAERSLRARYVLGLAALGLLVTAAYFGMQQLVAEQRDYAGLIALAGRQAGLTERIAYFAGVLVTSGDEAEQAMARAHTA